MSPSLATTWAERLRECERLLAQKPTELTWLRRAYARVYRFLLASYGDRAPTEAGDSSMPFVAVTESFDGKAARSAGEIQHTLKEIHVAVPELTPGDVTDGTSSGWIVIARQSRRLDMPTLCAGMRQQGIPARVVRIGGQPTLQVPMVRRQEAFAVLPTLRGTPLRPVGSATDPQSALLWRALQLVFVVFSLFSAIYLLAELPAFSGWEVAGLIAVMELVLVLSIGVATGAFSGGSGTMASGRIGPQHVQRTEAEPASLSPDSLSPSCPPSTRSTTWQRRRSTHRRR